MTESTTSATPSPAWMRWAIGGAVFAIATLVGVLALGQFADATYDPNTGARLTAANAFALILAIAMLLGAGTAFAIEWIQTKHLASVSRQFTRRVIVLMPVAIAINIVLGQTVATALKIPIYLDSIGTILVGVLAGPVAGALTGALANVLWSYVIPPPFQYPPAAAFAIVAAVIGVMAGLAGQIGIMRPRRDRSTGQLILGGLVTAGLIIGLGWLARVGYELVFGTTVDFTPSADTALFQILAWLAVALIFAAVLGVFALLFFRRDLSAAYVAVAGVVTGLVAALISAPIAAGVFGGVTGSGTDFLVAAFRQAGADVYAATTGQGLISDPIDKTTTFVIVYLILSALAVRFKARFPQGERLIETGEETS
jgi:uncharacterized membrane protein HdeD (DUF308 family)